MEKPTVITLGPENVLQYLIRYVEISQTKGTFNLAEADLLKRSVDVVYRGMSDSEITDSQGIELLIQAIYRGQAHGDYTLNDSSLLFNVVNYINSNKLKLAERVHSIPQPPTPELDGAPAKEEVVYNEDSDDEELSAPVPLMHDNDDGPVEI